MSSPPIGSWSAARVGAEVRTTVRQRARGCCEYCRIDEQWTGHEFTLGHVSPERAGFAMTNPSKTKRARVALAKPMIDRSVPRWHWREFVGSERSSVNLDCPLGVC